MVADKSCPGHNNKWSSPVKIWFIYTVTVIWPYNGLWTGLNWTKKRKRICGWRLKREINTLSPNWLLVLFLLRLWWSVCVAREVVIINSILQPKLCVYVHLITVQSSQGVVHCGGLCQVNDYRFDTLLIYCRPHPPTPVLILFCPNAELNNPWLKYYNNRLIFIRRTRDTEIHRMSTVEHCHSGILRTRMNYSLVNSMR